MTAEASERHPTPDETGGDDELRHYTPDEVATNKWLPMSARKIREMAYKRQIPHVNNGKTITLKRSQIREIAARYEVQPLTAAERRKSSAA